MLIDGPDVTSAVGEGMSRAPTNIPKGVYMLLWLSIDFLHLFYMCVEMFNKMVYRIDHDALQRAFIHTSIAFLKMMMRHLMRVQFF